MRRRFKNMSKFISLLCVTFITACNATPKDKDSSSSGHGGESSSEHTKETVPVYEGMSISRTTSALLNSPHFTSYGDSELDESEDNDSENSESEADIGDLISIDVEVGDEEKCYYVNPSERFIIEVHISNPDQFEIQSFTLNGDKYANYMFKEGSTMELLLLESIAPSKPGYYQYSIDAIKYIDGTEIKDVDMSKGEKSIKAGVTYNMEPEVNILKTTILPTEVTFNVFVDDFYQVLTPEKTIFCLSDGNEIIEKKNLYAGNNIVNFKNLKMKNSYQYGVVAAFDLIDGRNEHEEWLLKGEFDTVGAFVIKNVSALKESISFEIEKVGDVGTLSAIKLYDLSNNTVAATIENDERVFNNLLSDHEYKIVAEYTYQYHGLTVKESVSSETIRTLAKVQPIVHIETLTADKTSISYAISTQDIDEILEITSVELLKNGVSEKQNGKQLVGTFSNLLSNNTYELKVSYTYDLNDGLGVQSDFVTKNIKTSAKTQPNLQIKALNATKESIAYEIQIDDVDEIASISKVELILGDEVVQTNDNSLTGSFLNLLSNNIYYVKVSYTYDLNDGSGIQSDYVQRRINTGAKEAPSVEIASLSSEQESIDYRIVYNDIDEVGEIKKIELLLNDEVVATGDSLEGTFENLLSNNEYTVKVTYAYDLNDGLGEITKNVSSSIRTGEKAEPIVNIVDIASDKTSVSFDVETTDEDGVLNLVSAQLYDGQSVVRATADFENLKFGDLESGHHYKIVVNYTYDLNDGKGLQSKSVNEECTTLVETIGVSEIQNLNTKVVKSGEKITLRIKFDNPSSISISTIYVNNQPVEVTGGDKITNAIVEFVPHDTGLVTFAVSKVVYTLSGFVITQSVNDEVSVQYPVYSDLKDASFSPVTMDAYGLFAQGIIFHFDNELDYEIESFNDAHSQFRKIDDDTYFIKSNHIDSIEFGYEGYGSSSQTFEISYRYGNWNTYETVSTPEELLAMTDGYYILTNDIDLTNYPIKKTIEFSGFLAGNNHKISNLAQTVDTSNTQYYTPFAQGYLCDVSFENIFISVTGNADIRPFGYSNLVNCTVTGNINAYGNAYFGGGINNYNTSSTINLDVRTNGVSSTYSITGTKLEANSNVSFENGFIYYRNGDFVAMLGCYDKSVTSFTVTDETYIGDCAFSGCTNLETFVGNDDVIYGNNILSNGPQLKNATIPVDRIIDIDKSMLEEITIIGEGGVPAHAFRSLTHLKKVTIEEGITSIGEEAFAWCQALQSVELPSSLRTIGDCAFSNCQGLTSIVIPEGVTSVGSGLFNCCYNLTSAYLPSTLKETGINTFFDCTKLANVELSEGIETISSQCFEGCALKDINLPSTITSIEDYAFCRCFNLQFVKLPNGIKTISDYAFASTNLRGVIIPKSIETIGTSAFGDYLSTVFYSGSKTEWSNIDISSNNSALNNSYIEYDSKVTNASYITTERYGFIMTSDRTIYALNCLDNSITSFNAESEFEGYTIVSIANSGFVSCPNLTSVSFGDGLKYIGADAFYNCEKLSVVLLPSSLESISGSAFGGDENLFNVFYTGTSSEWENIAIGQNNNYLIRKDNFFEFESKITWVRFVKDDVCSYIATSDSRVLALRCVDRGITSINLNLKVGAYDSVSFAEDAFSGCDYLRVVILPDNISAIANGTFNACDNLKLVFFAGSEAEWNKIEIGENNQQLTDKNTYFEFNSEVEVATFVRNIKYEYVLTNDNRIFGLKCIDQSITSFNATEEFADYRVITLAEDAFRECSALSSVDLGYYLERIGQYAFLNCYSLTTVNIPSSLSYIGNNAFEQCTGLQSIIIPEGVSTIECRTFATCSNLKSVTLPSTLVTIANEAFMNCYGLTTIVVPNKVKTIGQYAFYNCSNLKAIVLPASIESLGDGCFVNEALAYIFYAGSESDWNNITIVDSNDIIQDINNVYFEYNSTVYRLRNVVSNKYSYLLTNDNRIFDLKCLDLSITSFDFENEFAGYKLITLAKEAFRSASSLVTADVGEDLAYVSTSAFLNCDNLVNVFIPEGVTEIKDYAFMYCYSLASITIPNSVKYIGQYAFYQNSKLTSINIPEGVEIIKYAAFQSCGSLASVNLPSSLKAIEDYAFYESGLISITIPEGVVSIGNDTFQTGTLCAVILPESIESIGSSAFGSSVKYVYYAGSSEEWNDIEIGKYNVGLIEDNVIFECDSEVEWARLIKTNKYQYLLTSDNCIINLDCIDRTITSFDATTEFAGYKLISLAFKSFYECNKLKTVELGTNLLHIGADSFAHCSSLTSIAIPEGIKILDTETFDQCSSLEYAILPSTLTSIGYCCFRNCPVLKSVNLPANLKTIDIAAFAYCHAIEYISLPSSLESLGDSAFYGCSSLKIVVMPKDIEECGQYAFTDCNNIKYVFYSGSETEWSNFIEETNYSSLNSQNVTKEFNSKVAWAREIDDGTYCYTLTSDNRIIDFNCLDTTITSFDATTEFKGYTIVSLANEAFSGCSLLTDVVLSEGLKTIGYNAFYNCQSLVNIILPSTVRRIGSMAFYNCTSLQSFVVPEGIEALESSTFNNCKSLASVTLPSTLKTIGGSAFYECDALTSIAIPDGVISFEGWTFQGCSNLKAIKLPSSLTALGDMSLYDCPALGYIFFGGSADDWTTLYGGTSWREDGRYYEFNSAAQWIRFVTTEKYSYVLTSTNSIIDLMCLDKSITSFDITTEFEGYKLISLAEGAFADCKALTSVNLGSNLTHVSMSAFQGCKNIESIVIPEGVTRIDTRAFNDCSYLETITLPSTLKQIGNYAFSGCRFLTSIVIPEGVTYIGCYAFYNCAALETVTLPSTLTQIADDVFNGCRSLLSIVIPNSVTLLGYHSFEGCLSLVSITLSNKLTKIEYGMFKDCSSLTSIVIPESVIEIEYNAFSGCYMLESLTLPSKLESIGDSAFSSCTSLRSVIIPNRVENIGSNAFYNCYSIVLVVLPKNIETIGSGAFNYCDNLRYVIYGGTEKEWNRIDFISYSDDIVASEDIFREFSSSIEWARTVVIDDYIYVLTSDNRIFGLRCINENITEFDASLFEGYTIITFANWAFDGCTKLTSITIPEGVIAIGKCSFASDSGLVAVIVPVSLTYIGEQAFLNDFAIRYVFYAGSESDWNNINAKYGNEAIINNQNVTYEFNSNVTSFKVISNGKYSYNLLSDKRIIGFKCIDKSITSFDATTEFDGYKIVSLADEAFMDCKALVSVNLGNYLTCLSYNAFNSCKSLTTVVLPASITSIETQAFFCCTALGSITIPEGVTVVSQQAFANCSSLISVNLPSTLTSIQFGAFTGCSKLAAIELPSSLETIGEQAFYYCNSIKTITIPSNVTSIGQNAFWGCTKLESVVISRNIESIGYSAFGDCYNIKYVFYKGSESEWNTIEIAAEGNNYLLSNDIYREYNSNTEWTRYSENATYSYILTSDNRIFNLKCLDKSITSFDATTEFDGYRIISLAEEAFQGCKSLASVNLGENLKIIGKSAFNECKSLVSIEIPNGVSYIDIATFFNCTKLESVTLPASLTTLKSQAFDYCTSLSSINLPNGMTSIGAHAFSDCTSLTSIILPSSIEEIGYSAFYHTSIVTFVIPEGVTKINGCTFYNCQYLCAIIIPDSVKSIDQSAFTACSLLNVVIYKGSKQQWNAIAIDEGNDILSNSSTFFEYESNVTWIRIEETEKYSYILASDNTIYALKGKNSSITNVDIPTEFDGYTVRSIANRGFETYSSLTSVDLGNNVKAIGYFAFWACNNLSTVTMNEGLITIGDNAFEGCNSLVSITLPQSLTYIGSSAFHNCATIKTIVIPNGISIINNNAFNGCSSLLIVVIPESVTSIGEGVFKECNSMVLVAYHGSEADWNKITIGGNNEGLNRVEVTIEYESEITWIRYVEDANYSYILTSDNRIYEFKSLNKAITSFDVNVNLEGKRIMSITNSAFAEHTELVSVNLGNDIKIVPDRAFYGCNKLASFVVPSGATSIGDYAFYYCAKMASITIANSVTRIGQYAFSGCSSLETLTLPESLEAIEYASFNSCSKLKSIIIPDNVVTINSHAFNGCTMLSLFVIPVSVVEISNYALFNCYLSSTVIYKGTNEQWDSIYIGSDNDIITKSTTTLVFEPEVEWVNYVENQNFSYFVANNNHVYEVRCTNQYITSFDASVDLDGYIIISFAYYAFGYCSKLATVVLPNTIKVIGMEMFLACSALTSINIPSSVTVIGERAFAYCQNLSNITFNSSSAPQVKTEAFLDCQAILTVTIPAGSLISYQGILDQSWIDNCSEHIVEAN